jgi:hypothetical protein
LIGSSPRDERLDSQFLALRKRFGRVREDVPPRRTSAVARHAGRCAQAPAHVTTARVCGPKPVADCSARSDKEFEVDKAILPTADDPVKRAQLFHWFTAKRWDKAERNTEIDAVEGGGEKDAARAEVREQGARACATAAQLRVADDVDDAIHHLRKSCSLRSFAGNAGTASGHR